MRHEPEQRNRIATAVVLASFVFAATASVATAQTGMQQAMLRSTAQATLSQDAAAPAPSTNVADALQQVSAQAAVIFTGSVAAVCADTAGGAKVTFAVEQSVRGTASGAGYTMHVSAWAGGAEHFHVGTRALFLLTAPSASGYSAPVMGDRGIVPLTGDALAGNLDLRWIGVDVQRGSPSQDAESIAATAEVRSTASVSPDLTRGAASRFTVPAASDAPTTSTLPDVHSIDRDLVLDLLRAGSTAAVRTR